MCVLASLLTSFSLTSPRRHVVRFAVLCSFVFTMVVPAVPAVFQPDNEERIAAWAALTPAERAAFAPPPDAEGLLAGAHGAVPGSQLAVLTHLCSNANAAARLAEYKLLAHFQAAIAAGSEGGAATALQHLLRGVPVEPGYGVHPFAPGVRPVALCVLFVCCLFSVVGRCRRWVLSPGWLFWPRGGSGPPLLRSVAFAALVWPRPLSASVVFVLFVSGRFFWGLVRPGVRVAGCLRVPGLACAFLLFSGWPSRGRCVSVPSFSSVSFSSLFVPALCRLGGLAACRCAGVQVVLQAAVCTGCLRLVDSSFVFILHLRNLLQYIFSLLASLACPGRSGPVRALIGR